MARRGMDKGHGRGYRNIAPMYAHDVRTHHLAGKGIKSVQKLPQLMKGDKVVSKFTQAKGIVVSKDPFAVKYQADSRDYVRLSNPKYWAKGGKLDSRFRNFRVLRVAASPPKNARIRLQDIGRKGHSLRMAYYKDGKWHTYQFLINKADMGTPKAQKLIASIKAKYHVRGGKDMPVKEIDEILSEMPSGTQVEATPSLVAKIGAGIKTGVAKATAITGAALKGTYEGLKEGITEYKQARKEIRAKEIAEELPEIKPKLKELEAQHNRVETLKQHIAEQDDKGMDTSSEISELEDEMEQLRKKQEEVTNLPIEDLSDRQLRTLAIRHKDTGLFGGNEFEDELVRRIGKTKELNMKIKAAQRKPTGKGFLTELFEV
jgi:hypothetical protein